MKNIYFLTTIFFIFISCSDLDDFGELGEFWIPSVSLESRQSDVLIRLIDSRDYLNDEISGLNAVFFKILGSTDNRNFTEIDRVDVSYFADQKIYQTSVENLEEGSNYYVKVEAIHSGEVKERTSVAIASPGTPPLSQLLFPHLSSELSYQNISPSKNYLSFYTYNPETRRNRLNIYNTVTGLNIAKVEDPTINDIWANNSKKFIYQLSEWDGEVSNYTMILYDVETQQEKVISESLKPSFSAGFSDDDKYYYHLLNDNDLSGAGTRTLWQYDINADSWTEKWKFELTNVYESQSRISFTKNIENYFFKGVSLENRRDGIFMFDMKNNQPHFITEFSERAAWITLSPDREKIAFASSKSGRAEIWVYDMEKHSFQQVTNSSRYDEKFSNMRNFNWISDNEIVAFLSESKLHQKEERLIITARVPD